MNKKLLLVDDDLNLLRGIKRQLRNHYEIDTASSGDEGLESLKDLGPFAVVISDMQMPGMNGVQFLEKVKTLSRNSTRIMLTGDAGQQTAVAAVNSGEIFRFVSKPCSMEQLRTVIDAGLEQYRLLTAERELLSKTLGGSVGILTEVLSLTNPRAFGRTVEIRTLVRQFCQRVKVANAWEIELAALLFPLGYLSVPEKLLDQVASGQVLSEQDQQVFAQHAVVGSRLVAKIPRLQRVAKLIAYQGKAFNGSGFPKDGISGDQIPLGARVLKLLVDFDLLRSQGISDDIAAATLAGRQGIYDPNLVLALKELANADFVIREIGVGELQEGMILERNLCSDEGAILIAGGRVVTSLMVERLQEINRSRPVRERILVRELNEATMFSVGAE